MRRPDSPPDCHKDSNQADGFSPAKTPEKLSVIAEYAPLKYKFFPVDVLNRNVKYIIKLKRWLAYCWCPSRDDDRESL